MAASSSSATSSFHSITAFTTQLKLLEEKISSPSSLPASSASDEKKEEKTDGRTASPTCQEYISFISGAYYRTETHAHIRPSLCRILQRHPELALEKKLEPVIQSIAAQTNLTTEEKQAVDTAFKAVALHQLSKDEPLPEALQCIHYFLYLHNNNLTYKNLDLIYTFYRLFFVYQPSKLSKEKAAEQPPEFQSTIMRATTPDQCIAAIAQCEEELKKNPAYLGLWNFFASDLSYKIISQDPNYLAIAIKYAHNAIEVLNKDINSSSRPGQFTILMGRKLLKKTQEMKRPPEIEKAKIMVAEACHYSQPKEKVKLLKECYEESKNPEAFNRYVEALVHANDADLFEAAEAEQSHTVQIYLAKKHIVSPSREVFNKSIGRMTTALNLLKNTSLEIQNKELASLIIFFNTLAIPNMDTERTASVDHIKNQVRAQQEAVKKEMVNDIEREQQEQEELEKKQTEDKICATVKKSMTAFVENPNHSGEFKDIDFLRQYTATSSDCAALVRYHDALNNKSETIKKEARKYLQGRIKTCDRLAILCLARIMKREKNEIWTVFLYGLLYMDVRIVKQKNDPITQAMRRETHDSIERYALLGAKMKEPNPEDRAYKWGISNFQKDYNHFTLYKFAQWMRQQNMSGRFPSDVTIEEAKNAYENNHSADARAPFRKLKDQLADFKEEEKISTITPIQIIKVYIKQKWNPPSIRTGYVDFLPYYERMEKLFDHWLKEALCLPTLLKTPVTDEEKASHQEEQDTWNHVINPTGCLAILSTVSSLTVVSATSSSSSSSSSSSITTSLASAMPTTTPSASSSSISSSFSSSSSRSSANSDQGTEMKIITGHTTSMFSPTANGFGVGSTSTPGVP